MAADYSACVELKLKAAKMQAEVALTRAGIPESLRADLVSMIYSLQDGLGYIKAVREAEADRDEANESHREYVRELQEDNRQLQLALADANERHPVRSTVGWDSWDVPD